MTAERVASETPALAAQRALVNRLCQAAAFPHPVQRLALIETHISFVILTGSFAYKIKKAIAFDFLDYTALDRRRFYCQEELRLNRRLAAPLYLDVVAIGGPADAPKFGNDSPVIEYAVRMAEFDQDCLLDRVLTRGELSSSEIDTLAVLVADFHRAAPLAAPEFGYGGPSVIERAMADNFAALRRVPGLFDADAAASLRPEIDRIEAWSRQRFAELQTVFELRRRSDKVRECHGDLHLGNMVRLADGLQVFDGIEFNADLRWIDVLSEIAFLAMDLSSRGRVDLAYRFINAYLENTGDHEGLGVFDFYFVYRALVRAKVSGIRAGQAAVSPTDRAAARAACRSYVALAAQEITPHRPGIILTHGFSGSGKTWAAGQLLEALPAIRLRSDIERKRLQGFLPLDQTASAPGGGIYDHAATLATYQRLQQLAEAVVGAGFTVIVDAAFLKRWQRDNFRRLGKALAVPVVVVDCVAPVASLQERIEHRQRAGKDASEAGGEVLALQLANADPLAEDEGPWVVPAEISADGGLIDRVRQLLVEADPDPDDARGVRRRRGDQE